VNTVARHIQSGTDPRNLGVELELERNFRDKPIGWAIVCAEDGTGGREGILGIEHADPFRGRFLPAQLGAALNHVRLPGGAQVANRPF